MRVRGLTGRGRRRWGVLALACCLGLLLVACGPGVAVPTPADPVTGPATTPAAPPVAALPPTATPGVAPTRAAPRALDLTEQIDELLAGRAGRYSVVIELPGEAIGFRNRAGAQVEAASLYKLAIMVELYVQREAGRLAFDDAITLLPVYFLEDAGEGFAIGERVAIGTLLRQMIDQSSNVAAAALLARVGNDNINATMRRLGLRATEIRWMPGGAAGAGAATPVAAAPTAAPAVPDEDGIYNVTSAADMARLYRLLLDGAVVSAGASAEMLALLRDQRINDRLPALLPAAVIVAHKTGNLPGVVHDAGVIYTPRGPAIVAVLSEGVDDREATDFIARLGALVYRAAAP